MTGPGVATFDLFHGLVHDLEKDLHPSRVLGWRAGTLALGPDATHFGVVVEGEAELECSSGSYHLRRDFFFAVPDQATVKGTGRGMVVSRLGARGSFLLGGPVEAQGRLRYIDGCSDSLLISPQVMGEPCLNLLSMPAGINQTRHTHPSVRVGVVLSGRGQCRTQAGPIDLLAGRGFILERDAEHSFHTEGEGLRIVVYHPDSDFGPTHDDHPMLNKTIVGGRRASEISEIRTR